jgi:phosphopantothenoylcysteine decarboxylase/phosphopantothenate--cysteine ligase
MEHPSKDICASKSCLLKGRKIALGICGSVAAVRAPDLARELMRHGAEVFVVMTPAAQAIISPELMEWATGNSVVTRLTGKIEHVVLGSGLPGCADLVLVAPATANTISKMAMGIDDTPVTTLATTAIGARLPLIVVPAMHGSMYHHPAVLDNIRYLESIGVTVIWPIEFEGKAKIAEIESIIEVVLSALGKKDMADTKVLVTAGPTRSYLDPVRYLTNPSSGRMGLALASEAVSRGAETTLVLGPCALPAPPCKVINVETTEEMLSAVMSELKASRHDLLVMAAAPLDFAFNKKSHEKISSEAALTVTLTPLPKIVKEVRQVDQNLFIIGFKAEHNLSYGELVERAKERLTNTGMDLIVANDLSKPGAGFEVETNEVILIPRDGQVKHLQKMPKRAVAKAVLDEYVQRRANQ